MIVDNIAFIGLGSNMDNPQQQIRTALKNISKIPHTTIIITSSFYITKPYGYLEQDDFVNAVCAIKTSLTCFDLLEKLQAIEKQQLRTRTIKWGPRTIDLDILAYNQEIIKTPDLKVPHPDYMNREFVVKPWIEIAPEWIMPNGLKLCDTIMFATDPKPHLELG